ncbi:MAG TPA: O-antigen ligase family protein [Paenibacillus sp.]|uniref:O-antigen ligase family protein n=1 Tax=Paenibacillus sp. TaxID=58172 RepID=UPI002CDEBB6E|nr:O-antigen ligase family protein [Paenibacillus sp.]HUC93641.1 O-antigen ligase family protein [Paenibacillus sp.]
MKGHKPKGKAAHVQTNDLKIRDFSLLHMLSLLGFIAFLFIFPFKAALFNGFDISFEGRIYGAVIYISLLFLTFSIYLLWKWKVDSVQSYISIFAMLIPLSYSLSSINAVSRYSASLMTLVMFMLTAFYIIGLFLAQKKLASQMIVLALQSAAYMVVLFGLLNLFGQVYYPDGLWLADNGYRLTSVFQYSNAYAAFLSAAILAGLYLMTESTKWYGRFVHALMLVPMIVSFFLTYSRGAIVLLPVIILLILPLLRFKQQIWYLVHFFIAGVLSLAILGKITENYIDIAAVVQPQGEKPAQAISVFSGLPLQSWAIMIGASALAACLSLLLSTRLEAWLNTRTDRLQSRKWSSVFVPSALIIAVLSAVLLLWASSGINGLLPEPIANRLANINFQQSSVLERKTFYIDALKVSRDYPLLGAGGGAWASLYEEYQNNPYVSRQAHSFFLQTLVEVGWLGLLVMLALFAFSFIAFLRMRRDDQFYESRRLVFYIFAIAMLMHSLIDFDMSYLYLAAIVFFSLGAIAAPSDLKAPASIMAVMSKRAWLRLVYPAVLIVLSSGMLVWSIREYQANRFYERSMYLAVQKQENLDNLLPDLNRAMALSPYNPAFMLTKIDWMSQAYQATNDEKYRNERKMILDRAQLSEPYNRLILLAAYRDLKDRGQNADVLSILEDGINKFQWDIKFYEVAIMEYFTHGSQNNDGNKEVYWQRALELYDEVVRRMKELEEKLPEAQLQGRAFNVTPMMAQAIGQIYYGKQDYAAAVNVLAPQRAGDYSDPYVRQSVRYYLAALNKSGQKDDESLNRLLQADPNEQALLDEITGRG